MHNVVTLVLGGGRGSRLYPLTKYRSKPAVPLAGKYRLIDIPLSNCITSGLRRIYVLTQFLSVSLHRHIRRSYRFDNFSPGFVELLAAQQTDAKGSDWYEGTADAVRKNVRYIDQKDVDYVLILSGDQLYRMDYGEMLKTHIDSGAEVTIGAMPVTREAASGLGVMRCDDNGQVTGFLEKPQTAEEAEMMKTDPAWIDGKGIPSQGRDLLASMGIYIFDRKTLVDVLTKTSYQDFGKEIFPATFRTKHVGIHLFDGYWEDIGTIRSFYESNLSLANPNPPFQLASAESPIYTRARYLPPSTIAGATINNSLISDGCQIGKGSVIENSVIGLRSVIGENVTIRDSVLIGADDYETQAELDDDRSEGQPGIGIGSGTIIEGAIVDKNCRIGENVRVVNDSGVVDSEDADDCMIRDGIPVVVRHAILPDGWKLQG